MWLPKLRELKEAVTVLFSPRFTTRFPARPHEAPENYRGKCQINTDHCIGCGACVNVCPTNALTQVEETNSPRPVRKITYRYDACIFCGNCRDNCTTEKGITLTRQWDLAGLDRNAMSETFEFDLQVCEKCGEIIGTKKHLVWLAEKLGPLAYTNPSVLLAKNADMLGPLSAESVVSADKTGPPEGPSPSDFMKILCPQCKRQLNIRL